MNARVLPLTVLAAVTIGCTNTPDAPSAGQPGAGSAGSAGATSPSSPHPETSGSQPNATPLVSGTGGGTTGSGVTPKGPRDWSADNPKRLYQLKTLKRAKLKAAGHDIDAWVMDTGGKREEGMMWLSEADVKPNEGMIFVFAAPDRQAFWMENTLIPLDIIYISADKKVVSVAHGKALDKASLPSEGLAQYVLEMKAGAAGRLGIKRGVSVAIPGELKSKD